MRYPLDNFTISQGFHAGHQAIDLTSPMGTPVKSPVTGTVIGRGDNPSYIGGLYLIVREDSPNRYEYYMGHHSVNHVGVGARVTEGQHIANVGMTGTATGPHVHFQIRRFGGGELLNPITVYNQYNPQGGGTSMNDDTARQVGYHFLGRNGFDGRGNALASGAPDLVGRPLTNQEFQNIFLSQESRNWRDSELPKVYGERNTLRAENANLNEQINRLKSDVTNANAQRDQAITERNTAVSERDQAIEANSTLQNENDTLKATVDAQAKRIEELEKESMQDITLNFNFVGNIFWNLIRAFGRKK